MTTQSTFTDTREIHPFTHWWQKLPYSFCKGPTWLYPFTYIPSDDIPSGAICSSLSCPEAYFNMKTALSFDWTVDLWSVYDHTAPQPQMCFLLNEEPEWKSIFFPWFCCYQWLSPSCSHFCIHLYYTSSYLQNCVDLPLFRQVSEWGHITVRQQCVEVSTDCWRTDLLKNDSTNIWFLLWCREGGWKHIQHNWISEYI